MRDDSKPRAYSSAYPGSMFLGFDGEFIRRDDPASLAAAMLELLAAKDREIEDLKAHLQSVSLTTPKEVA